MVSLKLGCKIKYIEKYISYNFQEFNYFYDNSDCFKTSFSKRLLPSKKMHRQILYFIISKCT